MMCECVCVCVRACVYACARACACVYVFVRQHVCVRGLVGDYWKNVGA